MKKFHQQRKGSTDTSKDQLIIYGRHAVISALKNPRRKIQKLLISAENRIEVEKAAPLVSATVIDKKDFAKFLPGDAVHLFRDGERPVFNVQVRPLEGQQFTAPQAGGQFQIEGRKKAPALRFREIQTDFLLRQNFHFLFLKLRQLAALGRIAEDQPLRYCLLQAVVQQRVDAPHHSWTEAFVLEFRKILALNSSALLEVVVKPLDLNGGQLVQRDAADSGDDVVLNVVGVVGFRVGPDAGLSVDLVPRPHP